MKSMVPTTPSKRASLLLMIGINLVFFFITHFPVVNLLLLPLQTFTTGLHELGHATACLATGGRVAGMTIVSDGQGHGGLTWCMGGIPFIFTQAGYLGAAFFGCILIWLGREEERSKTVLMVLGGLFALGCLVSISPMLTHMGSYGGQAWMSMVVGLGIGGALVFAGLKLSAKYAHFLLLVLAGQTALNSLTDILYLIQISAGFSYSGGFSDATNMARATAIPAAVWSVIWGAISLAMVMFTVKRAYRDAN